MKSELEQLNQFDSNQKIKIIKENGTYGRYFNANQNREAFLIKAK